MDGEKVKTVSALQDRLLHDPAVMERLLLDLSVNVTAMFRDPSFFLAFRERVVPVLRTYPFARLWVAGCSTGEEVYSLAIILAEEGLSDRVRIYATDINEAVIEQARDGVFPLDKMQEYTQNYIHAGGQRSFSEYYVARYDGARFARELVEGVVFAQHNLVSDAAFNEFHVITCRNVMIYFAAAAAGARAPALLREPRHVRRPRAWAEGDDPLLPARARLRGARPGRAALQRRFDELRGDRDRRVMGRAARRRSAARGAPARGRAADRGRPAPRRRTRRGACSRRCSSATSTERSASRATRTRSSRATSTSRRPTTTCSSTAGPSRSRSTRASSTRARRSTCSSSRSREAYRERAIGIVLTGANEDGAAGLAAIKRNGGVAIVQDPRTAARR